MLVEWEMCGRQDNSNHWLALNHWWVVFQGEMMHQIHQVVHTKATLMHAIHIWWEVNKNNLFFIYILICYSLCPHRQQGELTETALWLLSPLATRPLHYPLWITQFSPQQVHMKWALLEIIIDSIIKTHGSESQGQERAKRITKHKTHDELLCVFYTSKYFHNMTSSPQSISLNLHQLLIVDTQSSCKH